MAKSLSLLGFGDADAFGLSFSEVMLIGPRADDDCNNHNNSLAFLAEVHSALGNIYVSL